MNIPSSEDLNLDPANPGPILSLMRVWAAHIYGESFEPHLILDMQKNAFDGSPVFPYLQKMNATTWEATKRAAAQIEETPTDSQVTDSVLAVIRKNPQWMRGILDEILGPDDKKS